MWSTASELGLSCLHAYQFIQCKIKIIEISWWTLQRVIIWMTKCLTYILAWIFNVWFFLKNCTFTKCIICNTVVFLCEKKKHLTKYYYMNNSTLHSRQQFHQHHFLAAADANARLRSLDAHSEKNNHLSTVTQLKWKKNCFCCLVLLRVLIATGQVHVLWIRFSVLLPL